MKRDDNLKIRDCADVEKLKQARDDTPVREGEMDLSASCNPSEVNVV